MEIERKWMVSGWPPESLGLELIEAYHMRQGYFSVRPTVRIREEGLAGGKTSYVLGFKSVGTLVREEVEIPIPPEDFRRLEKLVGQPLIPKIRRTFRLPDGHALEVNRVDSDAPTGFWYAEIEFKSVQAAKAWRADTPELAAYLSSEVTEQPGYSMGAYWENRRLPENRKKTSRGL